MKEILLLKDGEIVLKVLKRRSFEDVLKKNIKNANEVKAKIEKENLKFIVQTGKDGRVFGSISSKQICDKLSELGYKVDKKNIKIDGRLSSLGASYVEVILYKKVIAKVRVELISK